jgi:HEAT repeat protein
MAVTRDQVVAMLLPDEPNYAAAASSLGPEVSPILADLAAGDDLELASKAASLAGFIESEAARPVLTIALAHIDPVVRTAAAASLDHHPTLAAELAISLLADPHVSVRKYALRALGTAKPPGSKAKVEALIVDEPVPALRELAHEVADQLP